MRTTKARPIKINFDSYTDNDNEFKYKLLVLMIGNLDELQQSMIYSIQTQDYVPFSKAAHKVYATLVILNDEELNQVIAEMKDLVCIKQESNNVLLQRVNSFVALCEGIIKSLENELIDIKDSLK